VLAYRHESGITKIVCLLNDSELRHLGVNVKEYRASCEIHGIIFYQYPIIEMAPPEDLEAFKRDVVDVIAEHLIRGNGNVLVHCRGGVGRAGLVTCCVLSQLC
jgi:protein-tyrosine phosphatase